MKITSASFLKSISIHDSEIFLEVRKEITFVGRSNVGKSSLMNALMQKKDLVKTSSRPGKTRTANVFLVNEKFYFTDLPGYGFAQLGQTLREDLDALISWYLEEKGHSMRHVFLLLDAKIGPQKSDIEMYNFILDLGLPVSVLLSKIDRLSGNEVQKSVKHTQEILFGARIFTVSSQKNVGINELRKFIGEELKK